MKKSINTPIIPSGKALNKLFCPYCCCNCETLTEFVKSYYENTVILFEKDKAIFIPRVEN